MSSRETNNRIAMGYLDLARLHRDAAQLLPVYSTVRAKHCRQAEYLESIAAGWLPLTQKVSAHA